jgi:putative YhdH/YhfP family quinone oxidoreductase
MLPELFRCFHVKKTGKDQIDASIEQRPLRELPAGDVLIEVAYSSLNYKDALAAKGHPGVTRQFPHVPGIDAAGMVAQSADPNFRVGDKVLITSYELGVERWGGWAQFVRVQGDWLVPLPKQLSLFDSMALGTGGLTAGLCLRALQHHDVRPEMGEVVVTGASGGVGCLAVMLLAKNGYSVTAVSGKPDRVNWLKELGAARVVGREAILNDSKQPLLAGVWGGAIDTVGGETLASLLRSVKHEGCVAACGVAGGADLNTSVYPFILRGVTLRGIDSARCPMPRRREVWDLLAGDWKLDAIDSISHTVGLSELPEKVEQILAGSNVGRTVIDVRR